MDNTEISISHYESYTEKFFGAFIPPQFASAIRERLYSISEK